MKKSQKKVHVVTVYVCLCMVSKPRRLDDGLSFMRNLQGICCWPYSLQFIVYIVYEMTHPLIVTMARHC